MNPIKDKQGEVMAAKLAEQSLRIYAVNAMKASGLTEQEASEKVRMLFKALRPTLSSSTRIMEAEDALSEASKALDSSRQWKGMGWEYLPIQPHNYKKAREAVSAYWTKREEESSAVPESADITPDLAKAYVAERDALLVWKDRALKAEAARCPLGLDDTPTICSAATCTSCKAWREYIARSSTTATEVHSTHVPPKKT